LPTTVKWPHGSVKVRGMEYRGKQYSVILTIGGKWKWSAEIDGQHRSGLAVSRPAGVELAEGAIDKVLAPKKKRLKRPDERGA
jgi:hypothetical protein